MREMLASHRVKAPSMRSFPKFVIVEYYDTQETDAFLEEKYTSVSLPQGSQNRMEV
jgi:hypothetical protein